MNETAKVERITRTHKWDESRTPVDIVLLSWNGGAYVWEGGPGVYAVGQEVRVSPPAHLGGNITPAVPPH